MKNIHVLPTDKPSRLVKNNEGKLKLTIQTLPFDNIIGCYPQSIYITSDEEIKDGDWCLVLNSKKEYLIEKYSFHSDCIIAKKIILTNNKDLIKDDVQVIDNEFLEYFVKNPSCEFVEVENDEFYSKKAFIESKNAITYKYKIIIPKEEPKQGISTKEIEQQIAITEARGEKIVKYLDKYKGQSIYNEIALAIEFGYQLKLEEDE
jgi:hypothetical protein